jgi:hypothetical protein
MNLRPLSVAVLLLAASAAACSTEQRVAGEQCTRTVQCLAGLSCIEGLCSDDLGAVADQNEVPELQPEDEAEGEPGDADAGSE